MAQQISSNVYHIETIPEDLINKIMNHLPPIVIMKLLRCVSSKWYNLCYYYDFGESYSITDRKFDSFLGKFFRKFARENNYVYFRPLIIQVPLFCFTTKQTLLLFTKNQKVPTENQATSLVIRLGNPALTSFFDYTSRILKSIMGTPFENLDTLILSDLTLRIGLEDALCELKMRSLCLERSEPEITYFRLRLAKCTTLKEFQIEFSGGYGFDIYLPPSVEKLKVLCNDTEKSNRGPSIYAETCTSLTHV